MGLRKLSGLQHKGKKLTQILEDHERFWKGTGTRAD